MTLASDIVANLGSLKVGMSAAYPLVDFRESTAFEAVGEQTASGTMLRRTWTMTGWTTAASESAKAALMGTLTGMLAKRGDDVVMTIFGQTRSMLAASAQRGWPRTTVNLLPDNSGGVFQFFEVIAETVEPIASGGPGGVAEHSQTTDSAVSQGGRETSVTRGTVVLIPSASGTARDWVIANVLPALQTAASAANLGVTQRYSVGDDGKRCEYEIALAEKTPASNGGGGITFAEVTDTSEVNDEGRTQRTVSGYAVGSNATTFAASQAPAGAGEVIVRENVSEPRDPDGRVTFSYTALRGVDSLDFPGAPLLSVRESFALVASGAPVIEAPFVNSTPILYSAGTRAFRYRQTTDVESLGELAGAPSLLASADFLAAEPVVTESRQGPIVRTSLTAEFVSTSPITPSALRYL
jgi:hypothetical protein